MADYSAAFTGGSQTSKSKEARLLDILQRIRATASSYFAIHINLSQLRPSHRQPHFIRMAHRSIDALTAKEDVQAFYMSMVVLIITPLVILPIMNHFFPDYQLGALLFMLMPSAISAPAVAGIYGGSVALASVNTVLSSLLSPFSIPILIGFFAGGAVKVSLVKILTQLLILMLTPFLLSVVAHHFAEGAIQKAKKHFGITLTHKH